jgi:cytochrome c oxidase subunit 1
MTPPTIAPAHPEIVTDGVPRARPGWIERATSADHKSVGLLYLGAALTFLAVAVVEFALVRVQLLVPENSLIQTFTFGRLVSPLETTAVLLFAIPLLLGLISYVVPLQIGARTVAFPRLNLLSAWLYLAGAATIYGSFMWRPTEGGLAAMPPFSDDVFNPTAGIDAWIIGAGLAIAGFVCFAINLLATVRNMRAPGMAWRRLPIFSWAATVSSYVLLVVGPVMLAALAMLMIDRNFDGVFFDPGEGGSPLLYEHFAWIFFTGAYAVVLVMAFGIVSEILPTFSRKPLFSHRAAMGSLAAVAVLAVMAWMQNMYSAPIAPGLDYFAMAFALALLIPVGLLFLNWVATIWGGTISLRAPVLYALGAISLISLGLCAELMYSVVPVGWQMDNTAAAQGATIDVLLGGGVLGGLAALLYWFPKISGRVMVEGPAKAAFWVILGGGYVLDVALFLAGLKGQPVDAYKYFGDTGLDGYNLVASLAGFAIAAGVLLALANTAYSYVAGQRAPHDPWGAATLEWFTLSPPPEHNFDAIPDVRSAQPLLDIREAIANRDRLWPRPEPAGGVPPEQEAPAEPAEAEPVEAAPAEADAGAAPAAERDDPGDAPLS